MLPAACVLIPGLRVSAAITGSASLGLSEALGLPFVQEVMAASKAITTLAPETDVAVELGGEDAKILYLSQGMDLRMNEACAGGTGAFIDQMAAFCIPTPPGSTSWPPDISGFIPSPPVAAFSPRPTSFLCSTKARP